MSNPLNKPPSTSENWNSYWQGTGNVAAYTSGGVNHPVINLFWEDFFASICKKYTQPKIMDVASGNGAVIEKAMAGFNDLQVDITSLDISSAAIDNIKIRFPSVTGIVADALSIPINSENFDIVTSQFGVEYAGIKAIYEAARLIKNNGILALLLHIESGSIHQECIESLEAVKRIQKCQFIKYAAETFDAAFAAIKGADRTNYEDAASKLAPAINELENIMKQYGKHVAGDTVLRIYNDVAQIHQRISHYEPKDVLNWLEKMDNELESYAGRMSSMKQSTIGSEQFKQVVNLLKKQGFLITRSEPLQATANNQPIAWVLIAEKNLPY